MYGVELNGTEIPDITSDIHKLGYKPGESGMEAYGLAQKLYGQSARLFARLTENIRMEDCDDPSEIERFKTNIDDEAVRHLRRISDTSEELSAYFYDAPLSDRWLGRSRHICRSLTRLRERTRRFERHGGLIYWLEDDRVSDVPCLCGIPKNIDELLYRDLWRKGIPVILTSGTLSAGGSRAPVRDFSYIKRMTGLDKLPPARLSEISLPSPFNFKENALIYISENVPFPDRNNCAYISKLSAEIVRIVKASHGHAAVLFTSYRVMGQVYALVSKCGLPFPIFRMERGGTSAIERFKRSGNGILFASGSMWEGIDVPGDALSMLIIVKLPYDAPDPVSEYERTLYGNFMEFRECVLQPNMLIKNRQGIGRGHRMEDDATVIAMFDSRLRKGAALRGVVLVSLPDCPVTDDVREIEKFYEEKKSPEYFI
jgi:ATP-dependent DNA helicase DinG